MNKVFLALASLVLGGVAIYYGICVITTGEVRHPTLHPYPLWNPPPVLARVSGIGCVVIGLALIWRGLGF